MKQETSPHPPFRVPSSEFRIRNVPHSAFRNWGSTSNPPLLLLHGFMGCAEDWDTTARYLQSDFLCIAPSFPGHGKSPFDPEAHGTFEGYANSVIALLDELGHESVSALGYSMGGRILLSLALRYPERFSRVILESASPGIADTRARAARRKSDQKLAARLQQEDPDALYDWWYSQALFGGLKQSTAYPALLQRRLQNDPHGIALALSACGTGQQHPYWKPLATLKPDTLLIYGEHDQTYKEVTAQMRSANRAFQTGAIAGCSHAAHVEDPKQFVEQCRSFLLHRPSREEQA